jgi:Glyoxalase-like domain
MSRLVTKVDHAIFFVRDLGAAEARYRRLGFAPTPRYTHPWGGFENVNLMFQDDYVELLRPVEPTDRNLARFREMDRAGEGLKDVSLAVPDSPAAARAYRAAGLPSLPPADIGRPVTRPDGTHEAKFCVVYLPVDRLLPGLNVHMIQHMTPELVWIPEFQTHPNGARGLGRLVIAADDPAKFAAPYAAMFEAAPAVDGSGGVTMPAAQMRFDFVPPGRLAALFPGVRFTAPPPFVAALEIRVEDAARARRHLEKEGVAHRVAADGALEVPPDQACGAVIRLRQQ